MILCAVFVMLIVYSNLDRLEFKASHKYIDRIERLNSNLDRLEFKVKFKRILNRIFKNSNLDRLEFKGLWRRSASN